MQCAQDLFFAVALLWHFTALLRLLHWTTARTVLST
jgi:hypothetical protein